MLTPSIRPTDHNPRDLNTKEPILAPGGGTPAEAEASSYRTIASRSPMHVLYMTQTGLAEPLARSQVIPYIRGLAERGHRFTVISLERSKDIASGESNRAGSLLPSGTRWIALRYHRWPPLLSTAFDIASGVVRGLTALRGVDLIHARSTVPALMARILSFISAVPWIFDVRGFLAEEYVDVGHWKSTWTRARLVSALERRLIREAAGRVFLTRRARLRLENEGLVSPEMQTEVIPCAVDLERFRFSDEARQMRRKELGLAGEVLLVYAGSLGSWNPAHETMRFFAALQQSSPRSRFLVLTANLAEAEQAAAAVGVLDNTFIRTVTPDDVPGYLSAADLGVAFTLTRPSKNASSPTKVAEYLACGLPVVVNPGVGDLLDLEGNLAMVAAPTFDDAALRTAAERAVACVGRNDVRQAARALAERNFSVGDAADRYDALYCRAASRDLDAKSALK